MKRPLAVLTLAAASVVVPGELVGCGDRTLPPRGQVVLYLDTDAPIAPALTIEDPAPLFDRVLVELFEPNATEPCPDCRREIVVDPALMKDRRFSFGFVPRPRVVGYRAHLVLYRAVAGLAPRPNAAIELVGYLPAVAEDGKKELTARFRTEDVGRPRGTMASPILFDAGPPSASAIGTWPGARVTTCPTPAPDGRACVAGGAFWMGDPRVTIESTDVGGAREHLTIVAPFFLDLTEVTVASIRASKLAKLDSRGKALDPQDDLADTIAGQCDYSAAPGTNEALPVSCISWELASAYCRAMGGDLPTEAQIEIAASVRGTRLTPWGDRDPTCEEAAVARGARGPGGCSDAGEFDLGHRVLPLPPGSGSLDRVHDRVVSSGGEIVDLGANLAEWTRDTFQNDEGDCWSSPLLDNPSCAATDPRRSAKAGDVLSVPVRFVQTRRAYDPTFAGYPDVGFRCAYPAK